MLRFTWLILASMICTSFAAAQVPAAKPTVKKIENPQYKQWAGYKPGTWVTVKTVADLNGQKTETDVTTTLKSVSDEKLVVAIKTTMYIMGEKIEQPATETTYKAMIPEMKTPELTTEKPKVETGKEELTVMKKKLECVKTKTTSKFAGGELVTTAWTSKEIPGELVKSVSKMSAGTTTMSVTAYEVKK